jgi:hypothetical protein
MNNEKILSVDLSSELYQMLKNRFEKNMHRHEDIEWYNVIERLDASPDGHYTKWKTQVVNQI